MMMVFTNPRAGNFAGFLGCAFMMACALYFQHGLGMEPCPLCVFQRVATIALGVVFLAAALHDPRGPVRAVYTVLLPLVALAGGAIMLKVDKNGFDQMDRRLLRAVIEKFDGGPVGLDSLAAAIGEERGTIEDVLEPYLIQQGYLMRTPRGRMATRASFIHFRTEPTEERRFPGSVRRPGG